MSDNPFYYRRNKHSIGRSGRASETKLGKSLGAQQTAASGALQGFKGDLQLKDFLIEAKSTTGDSMGLKFDWLAKIAREARQAGRKPALSVSFVNGAGSPFPHGEWVLIPMSFFRELVEDA